MNTPLRALIVEDSKVDAELVLREMIKAGYQPAYQIVDNLDAMRLALKERSWDVIISDYSMPQFGGPASLAHYKETALDIPFISVSGTIGEEVAVEMMKAGAHDYVMKDNLTRLGPAIERELRATQERAKRKRAENQAAHLAAIVQSSDDAIISKTIEGIILSWNHGATQIYGYTAGEMVGRSISVLIAPYRLNEWLEIVERLRRGEPIDRFETVHVRKSGKPVDVSVVISTIIDAEGKIIGVSSIARDIAESRERENEHIRLIEELTDALTHLKTLRGLLPICAWCKKIRDDKGYWQQVETYLKEHSQADFTHGICPDCAKQQNQA